MRKTVSQILSQEADRLLAISISEGLTDTNLQFLNKLIDTYEKFVAIAEEEAPPEEQGTADLLASLLPSQEESCPSETKTSKKEKPSKACGTLMEPTPQSDTETKAKAEAKTSD